VPEDPLAHFAELMAALRQRRAPSDAAAEWWIAGVQAGLRDGSTLDRALGLSAPGARSWRTSLLQAQRDHHLVRAARAVVLDDGQSDWACCQRLAPLVRAFVANVWPRLRDRPEPPEDWPTARRELFLAARTGLTLPSTPRGLLKVVSRATTYSVRSDPATVGACPPNK